MNINENNTELPKLLTPKEVGEYLHIGQNKLYDLMKRRDFPSIHLGGRWYIIEPKFIEWMEQQTKKLKYHV